jgi:hypothetical protein
MAVSIHVTVSVHVAIPVHVRARQRGAKRILFHMLPQTMGYAPDAAQTFSRHVEFLGEMVLLAKNREDFTQFDRIDPEIFFETGSGVENLKRVAGYLRKNVPDLIREITDPGLDSCAHN